MTSSSLFGEQEFEGGEDEKEEGSRSSASTYSVPCSSLPASTQDKSRKKNKIWRLWLPRFLRRSRRRVVHVDKPTSTDLCLQDVPQASDQQDHRQEPPAKQNLAEQHSDTLPGNEECVILLSKCDSTFPPSPQGRPPCVRLTTPREHCPHKHQSPSKATDNHLHNIVDAPDGDARPMPRPEVGTIRDFEKVNIEVLPSRKQPRKESEIREPSSRHGSHGGDRSPGGREYYRKTSPKWRTSEEMDSPGRKSPSWEREQCPRKKSPEAQPPRWKYTYGWQDMSPGKDESVATRAKSRDRKKSAPLLRKSSATLRKRTNKDEEALAGRTGVFSGSAVAMVCCLLIAVAVFIGVHTSTVCVGRVSWAVMPMETLVLELVSVTLLVLATASILILVDGFSFCTEFVVTVILIFCNAALVELVGCLSFTPGSCLWLSVLVLPLFLLTLFVMCREVFS